MEVREPDAAYGRRQYTIQEYLAFESTTDIKHEYYRGDIFAMAGAKLAHNRTVTNILALLLAGLKGSGCMPYGSDMRIHIEKNTLFTYPDISVFCGEPLSLNNDEFNFLNPTLIIEVGSPATRQYDLGEKYRLYQDIPTLLEYAFFDSTTRHVVLHTRRSDSWNRTILSPATNILELSSIGITLDLNDVYEGVKFAE